MSTNFETLVELCGCFINVNLAVSINIVTHGKYQGKVLISNSFFFFNFVETYKFLVPNLL